MIIIRYPWLTYWFFDDFCLHPVYLPCADKPGSLGSPASDLVFDLLPLFFSAVICKARRVFHLAGSVASLCLSSVLTDGGENTQVLLITWLKCPQALMPTRCCFVSSLGPKAWVASVNRIAVHKRITNVCCCCFFFTFPKVGCVHWIFIFFLHSLLLQLPLKLTTFYFILGVLKL